MRVLPRSEKSLLLAVIGMTLVGFALGAAVLVIKLRPGGEPRTAVERDITEFQNAVRANPNDDWAQTGLGLAMLNAKKPADAQRAFEAAVEVNPKNWVASFQLGLLLSASDPVRADSLLATGAKYAPETNKAAPYIALGDLRLQQGDAESAKAAYRRAIADVPFLYDSHLGLRRDPLRGIASRSTFGDAKRATDQRVEPR